MAVKVLRVIDAPNAVAPKSETECRINGPLAARVGHPARLESITHVIGIGVSLSCSGRGSNASGNEHDQDHHDDDRAEYHLAYELHESVLSLMWRGGAPESLWEA